MSDHESFRQLVAGNKNLEKKWREVSDAAIEHAARHGIVMTKHDCLMLDRLRLATVSGDDDLAKGWQEEAESKIPAFAQKAESRKFREAMESANENDAAQARADIMARSPQERMRIGREIMCEQHAKPVTTKKELTAEERAKVVAELDAAGIKGSERIARARAAGLE